MTFTDTSWLQYQYNYTVSYIFPDDYLIQNRVRNDVSKRYDDSISLKIRACGGLKNPGKSRKYTWNSIYEEFKSRVNQPAAAVEHKSKYVYPKEW